MEHALDLLGALVSKSLVLTTPADHVGFATYDLIVSLDVPPYTTRATVVDSAGRPDFRPSV